jgi:hypothetical protein
MKLLQISYFVFLFTEPSALRHKLSVHNCLGSSPSGSSGGFSICFFLCHNNLHCYLRAIWKSHLLFAPITNADSYPSWAARGQDGHKPGGNAN